MKIRYNFFKPRSILLYSMALMVVSGLFSCKKFLETLPDQRTELNSAEKISELLVSAYPTGNHITFTEAMSDNATDNYGASTVSPYNTEPYFWRNVTETSQDSPDYYWNACYKAIAAANQALESIEQAGDENAYRAQKGEALVCRAYAHFMLVSLYSKTYNEATASSDPGIPYVDKPETVVFGQYTRGTVKDVYDRIEDDLKTGLPLLDDSKYKVPRYHFNRTAARAFAARFYLFKRDYDQAIQYASDAFPNENWASNMRPWLTEYQDYSSTELSLAYLKTTENANLLMASTVSRLAAVTEAKALSFYNTTDAKEAVIMAILDYKRAEFVHEGMRWFDILRHDIPVVHTTYEGQTLTLPPGDPRRVIQIPGEAAEVIGSNPR